MLEDGSGRASVEPWHTSGADVFPVAKEAGLLDVLVRADKGGMV